MPLKFKNKASTTTTTIIKNDTTSIMVIYHTVYYLLSETDFNGHKFNFIKCTVYSKCQEKYHKNINIMLILVLKMFKM